MGTIVEDLQAAKVWLLEHEWVQGAMRSPDEKGACAVGALWPPGEADLLAVYARIRMLDRVAQERGYIAAYIFNDAEETTFNDVISLYEDAIVLAKEEGV